MPAGSSLPDLALRFILHHPAVSTTIPGMRKPRHVEANIAASDAPPLGADLVDGPARPPLGSHVAGPVRGRP